MRSDTYFTRFDIKLSNIIDFNFLSKIEKRFAEIVPNPEKNNAAETRGPTHGRNHR